MPTERRPCPTVSRSPDPMHERFDEVLTPEALALLATLHRAYDARRRELLEARQARQADLAAGGTLDFLAETKDVREDESWRVADPAPGLEDRRVEITGPTDRKMTINALNSGAKVWLADHEDANTPLWENMVGGQLNLRDAIERTIDFTSPEGKTYALDDDGGHDRRTPARLAPEREARARRRRSRCPASLFDFALYFFHCAPLQIAQGLGPYFYLPKMESHLEARLWNDVFVAAQDARRHAAGHHPRDRADRDLSRPRSRWRRSSTSCATTPPGSTPAAGTTCSASSRPSAAAAATSCCPTATR